MYSRDVKFTINELEHFVAKSGLNFVKHSSITIMSRLFDIDTHEKIPEIWSDRLIKENKKMAMHELISGNVIKHEITVSAMFNTTERLQKKNI